ncbi:TonB-dependent receptor [Aurantiacibacter rhizosphaerae]|uniref:TonB-dependent receptor n=1 Tax=Aurantiacibacter rhizosphaerae TaxID=2691582 RepID=A0A844XCA1_9SPHN|nr:TonB-dependent receptor [Aurantiacibacter rhizosphaerae]MWV27460.1 TonB-dependent receptor [Aurantiacibacter rhizosphaerae]
MTSITAGPAGFTRKCLCGVAAIALVAPVSAYAQAQVDTVEPVDEPEMAQGNSIVVTATKREQTLQEIPVAVSVTTAETLDREQIRDLKDLQSIVPSLRVTQLQSSANTNFIIRGFGNGANNAGIEPSVGVFIDNVYRSRSASQISDLPNVSRIEVLRGPQSTLFGKNASAGIISMVTSEPSFNLEGTAEVSYGNYDAMVARGYITGPLGENVAASFAAGINKRDGYNYDPASDTTTNERDRWFVRGQLLFDNAENFSARIIADYDRINENCCGVVNIQPSSFTQAIQAVGGQVNAPADAFDGIVYNNFPSTNDVKNYGLSAQLDYDVSDDVALTSITSYRETRGDFGQDVDFTSGDLLQRFNEQALDTFTQEFRVSGDWDRISALAGVFYFNESVIENQTVNYGQDFRPFANVLTTQLLGQSLTQAEGLIGALSGNPAQFIGTFFAPGRVEGGQFTLDNESVSLFSQVDFEIVDGLTLTLGGNYTMDEKTGTTDYQSFGTFSNIDLVTVGNRAIVAQGIANQVGAALMLGRPATQAEIQAFATGMSPAGAAGAAAFPTIQAGVQAFANANDANPAVNPLLQAQALQNFPRFVNIPNVVESGKTDDKDFSYTARLAYDINPDLNIYASYATGFKASSFALSRDSRPARADAAALAAAGLLRNNQTFGSRFAGPEESKVIEVGLKGNWGDYSANLTGFRQDIDGFQSNVFTGTGFFLANAGKQRTYGVEFEGTANPVDPLTLSLAVTWLDPSYVSFPLSPFGDISGTTPAGIPEWSVVIGGQYAQPMGNGDELILRSTYAYESEVQIVDGLPGFLDRTLPDGGKAQALAAATPFTRQVDELSASLTYVFDEPGIELSVWGRNLLDDRYFLSIFDSPAQPGSISAYPNQPRTYGATAKVRF